MKQLQSRAHYLSRSSSLPKTFYRDNQKQQQVKKLSTFLDFYKKRLESLAPSGTLAHVNRELNAEQQNEECLPSVKIAKSKAFPPDYDKQCMTMLQNLCFHFEVFKKLLKNSQRKRTAMSRLYGWDEEFAVYMFNGEQIRSNLVPKKLYLDLGLDKKNLKGRNTYNKLRLFLAELISFNRRHQEKQCSIQIKRFNESVDKLNKEMTKFKAAFRNTEQYQQDIRATHHEIMRRKMRIKNKSDQLYLIGQETGAVKINEFFFYEEKNIDRVEKMLRSKIH